MEYIILDRYKQFIPELFDEYGIVDACTIQLKFKPEEANLFKTAIYMLIENKNEDERNELIQKQIDNENYEAVEPLKKLISKIAIKNK